MVRKFKDVTKEARDYERNANLNTLVGKTITITSVAFGSNTGLNGEEYATATLKSNDGNTYWTSSANVIRQLRGIQDIIAKEEIETTITSIETRNGAMLKLN